jgi:subtilisin family serine protease
MGWRSSAEFSPSEPGAVMSRGVCRNGIGRRSSRIVSSGVLALGVWAGAVGPASVLATAVVAGSDRAPLSAAPAGAATPTAAPADQFVVRVSPATDAAALGRQLGASLFDAPANAPGQLVFRAADPAAVPALVRRAEAMAGVVGADPLVARHRYARDAPNDPLFASQWHLRNTGQGGGLAGADANLTPVWNFAAGTGLGAGVNIAIVDDGLERTHADLAGNYVPALSFDFNGNDADPSPGAGDDHGTSCAGVAAGRGNNGVGVSGAAPRAGLSGVRLIAAPATDLQESQALTFRNNNQGGSGTNHVYSNSWGPSDDNFAPVLEGPGSLTRAAMADAVRTGRGGKGSVFVWAGGNGGTASGTSPVADNSNYDGYANSRFVIAVGASTNAGTRSSYSERGANLFVNAPSNGGSLGITTVDRTGTSGYNTAASASGGDYTADFGGTSSAAPLVAGVAALMLEANPALGWRDVKHVLARTAVKNDPTDAGWTTNAAGRHHNDKYGFGRIDAAAAVALAKTWTNVSPELSATASATVGAGIPDGTSVGANPTFGATLTRSLSITTALNVETVEVTVDVTHAYRGDLEFTLTGPSGVQSVLGTVRSQDAGDNFANWTFTSVRYWDESSLGTWTLGIRDGYATDAGTWNAWSLAVFGTAVPEPAGAGLLLLTVAGGLLARRARSR